jgi:uncharacterized membrane protein YczE
LGLKGANCEISHAINLAKVIFRKMITGRHVYIRYILILSGFFIMGIGTVMTINAKMGVSAWNVLHLGLTQRLPITVGQATQGVGLFIIAFSAIMGIKPKVGTWTNLLLVGLCLDLVMASGLVPIPAHFLSRIFLLIGGLIVLALGMCLYMCAGLGTGPRDSLMLALSRLLPGRVAVIRAAIELSALFTGYLLGGPVGVGTLLAAFILGWFIECWFIALYWARRYFPVLYFLQVPQIIDSKLIGTSRANINNPAK